MREIPFSPPDITREEVNNVAETLLSGWITTGPKTKELEREIAAYVGVNKCACLSSATAALEATLHVLGVGHGDEVITTAYTYTATAAVIHHLGAKIVLVDTAKESFEMDYDSIENLINENTKAIIPVDLGGKPCDYHKLFEIVEAKKKLFKPRNDYQKAFGRVIVLSDGSHALGAERYGISVGNIADFTCFSFHAVKNFTTAEGGAVTWKKHEGIDDEKLYTDFMLYSLHGQSKDALHKDKKGNWEYDILYPAYKCNMTDIMASIGIVQMKRYPDLLNRRREIVKIYQEMLKPFEVSYLEHFGSDYNSSCHLFLMRIADISAEERNEIIQKYAENGIATNVHYKPLPLLTAYKNLGFSIDNYPNAFNQYKNEITLPLYTRLSDDDIEYIVQISKKILRER
jgi:dTDP-4-amino-4,6-dideoxygalactose transaminase